MRLLLLTAVLAVASGCTTTTHVVDRADARVVARVDADLRGRQAVFSLASGIRSVGRVEYVRLDSAAWTENDILRAVPTNVVLRITADNRARQVERGALIGLFVGLGAAAVAVVVIQTSPGTGDGFRRDVDSGLLALTAAPVASALGAAAGRLASRRIEVVFVGGAPVPTEPPR